MTSHQSVQKGDCFDNRSVKRGVHGSLVEWSCPTCVGLLRLLAWNTFVDNMPRKTSGTLPTCDAAACGTRHRRKPLKTPFWGAPLGCTPANMLLLSTGHGGPLALHHLHLALARLSSHPGRVTRVSGPAKHAKLFFAGASQLRPPWQGSRQGTLQHAPSGGAVWQWGPGPADCLEPKNPPFGTLLPAE